MPRQLTLAKLTQPKLFGVAGRSRLHVQLDKERANHPVIWIVGPPGAGKTTFVASYLDARELPAIWYQVDSGDADLATFFYYMGLAGRIAAKRKRLLLPLLTPEYLSDLPGFTRRFFRKLFSTVSESSILVLDNYQEVTPESVFHTVIDVIISELPPGHSLIAISRTDPPPQLARALANNLIGQVNWNDLRLTLDETKAIVAATGILESTEETLKLLQEQTNGWIAGLVLMMERFKETGAVNHISQPETMGIVFNYFAGQVFEQLPLEMREFLMRTAILSHMTVKSATEMGKSSRAKEWLNYLYRRRLFIDRRISGDEISYQYHALFREFLQDRARTHFSLAEFKEIRQLGAKLTEQSGEILAAAGLLAKAEDWQVFSEMINRQASSLLNQGRHQTLQEAIAMLPEEIVSNEPWLLYWRGISYVLFDPQKAKDDFDKAFVGFQVTNDTPGLFLSCGEIIDAYFYSEDDIKPVIKWADQLYHLLKHYGDFPSFDVEIKLMAKLQGLIFAAPHHPLLEVFERRLESALHSNISPLQKIAITSTIIWLPMWRGDFRKTHWIIKETNLLLKAITTLPPMLQILWLNIESIYAWSTTAPHDFSDHIFQKALRIGQEHGISIFNVMLMSSGVYGALAAGNVKFARIYLEQFEANLLMHRKHEITQFYFLAAGIEFLEGNMPKALENALVALKLHEEVGRPFLIETTRLNLAQILIENDDMEIARSYLYKSIQYARIMRSSMLEHQCLLIEAYSWLKQGDTQEAFIPLCEGLRIARENDFLYLNSWWRPHVMARLFSLALQHGIEVDYVKSVIRRRNIKAESPECDHWPWPIKIFTLGKFEIQRDDVPLRFPGKAQHKPLELLKYLCASGGKAVNQDRIIDALWPDSMGDAAEQALRTTLHRLRKLLRHDQAIVIEDKHLSLDFGYVWTDCGVFDHIAHHQSVTNDRISLQQALNYYHGHFLEGETSPWAITFRNQLRAHYTRIIEQYGALLEQDGEWSGAIECYLRAIEIEPLVEVFYNNLMNIYIQHDRRSEALAVYQRCCQSLLTRLGINPSSSIQVLYHKIINPQ
ncbi:MAG: winged helix-turn-helix domain-containing protein [Nitrosomonas sp.]|nr:winged helix-turn-helix domain-containing protein [Nitrosomonas sp.]